MSKLNLPLGTRDEFGPLMKAKQRIIQTIQAQFLQAGFEPIKTPLLEYADVFAGMAESPFGTYNLSEEDAALVLRPDLTLPIARVMSTTGLTPPVKFSYSGDVFRRHKRRAGDFDQISQAGVEIIGYPGRKAEEECLLLAGSLCFELGIDKFTIEVGNAGFVDLVLASLKLDATQTAPLKKALLSKNLTAYTKMLARLPENSDTAFLKAWPWLFGPVAAVKKQVAKLQLTPKLQAVLADLSQACDFIQRYLPKAQVTLDLCSAAPQPYYTGLSFYAYGQSGDYLFSGGRYDRLLSSFQQTPLAAVGFAFDVDALAALVPKPAPEKRQLVYFNEDQWPLAQSYVQAHANASLCLSDTLKQAKAQAQSQQADLIDLTAKEDAHA